MSTTGTITRQSSFIKIVFEDGDLRTGVLKDGQSLNGSLGYIMCERTDTADCSHGQNHAVATINR